MPHKLLKWPVVAAMTVLIGLGLAVALTPGAVRTALTAAVSGCRTCHISFGAMHFSPLAPASFEFEHVIGVAGDAMITQVRYQIERVTLQVALWPLMTGRLVIHRLFLDQPHITIVIGEKTAPAEPEADRPPRQAFAIHNAKAEGGTLVVKAIQGTNTAILTINKIQASLDLFATEPALLQTPVHAMFAGQIENSGQAHLDIQTAPFHKPLVVEVTGGVQGLHVAELNPYFTVTDGVELNGELLTGSGVVQVHGNKASAWVRAEYRDLAIKLIKTRERSGVSAFFMNLISQLTMKARNTQGTFQQQTHESNGERKPQEALVSFILRALKDAALPITTQ